MSGYRCRTLWLLMLSLICHQVVQARCGSVDYSQGADALASLHDYIVTITRYVVEVIFAGAAILAIVSAFQIYIKLNLQEGEITKNILMLLGAIIFLLASVIVSPALFGYEVIYLP